MVVNVELTLSSIIQGVALSFLAENAKEVLRAGHADCATPNSCRLYDEVLRDQRLNIRLIIPAIFVFELLAALLIRIRPDFFLARHGHLLISSAVLGLLIYLGIIIRSFIHMTPLIAETRADWRGESPQSV